LLHYNYLNNFYLLYPFYKELSKTIFDIILLLSNNKCFYHLGYSLHYYTMSDGTNEIN